MRRFLAVFGTALLVGLGLLLPRLTAAVQERGLADDVRRRENAAVSLTLAQALIELPELDLFQSLELFSSPVTMVELEEGSYTSAEGAARTAGELAAFIPADAYLEGGHAAPDLAVPFLLTGEDGRSGVFWRCSWEGRPDEAIWIDDQNQSLAGFRLRVTAVDLDSDMIYLCMAICDSFYLDVGADVFWAEGGDLLAALHSDEKNVVLPAHYDAGYLYFNLSFPPDFDAGIDSIEAMSIAE